MDLTPSAALEAETVDARRRRARSLAAFFAGGACLSSLVLLTTAYLDVPTWSDVNMSGIAVTVILAASSAGILATSAERVGARSCHLFTAAGSLLIAACQVLSGGASAAASYSLLYVWVVLHASLFFSRSVITAQLLFSATVHGLALAWIGEASLAGPQLILTVGTQLVAALVVHSLAEDLRQQADTDPLTGLGNRRQAHSRLGYELSSSRRRQDRPTCVAVFDLDNFKAYNDERGHVAGDLLLAEIAASWRGMLRGHDVVTRTGGDEFTLVLADCDLEVAAAVVRRMLAHPIAGVTCSAGLALWDGQEPVTDLMRRVDEALYAAKENGPLVIAGPRVEVGTK